MKKHNIIFNLKMAILMFCYFKSLVNFHFSYLFWNAIKLKHYCPMLFFYHPCAAKSLYIVHVLSPWILMNYIHFTREVRKSVSIVLIFHLQETNDLCHLHIFWKNENNIWLARKPSVCNCNQQRIYHTCFEKSGTQTPSSSAKDQSALGKQMISTTIDNYGIDNVILINCHFIIWILNYLLFIFKTSSSWATQRHG